MSKENLEQFMNKVAESEELQYRMETRIDGCIDAEALIALGAECGCEFTAEDLQDYASFDTDNELCTCYPGGPNLILQYIPKNEYVAARLMDQKMKTSGVFTLRARRKMLRKLMFKKRVIREVVRPDSK